MTGLSVAWPTAKACQPSAAVYSHCTAAEPPRSRRHHKGDRGLSLPAHARRHHSVQLFRSVIEPGGGTGGPYPLDTATIFAMGLSGSTRLIVGGEARILPEGASTSFSGRTLHQFDNPGTTVSEVLRVLSPPLPRAARGPSSILSSHAGPASGVMRGRRLFRRTRRPCRGGGDRTPRRQGAGVASILRTPRACRDGAPAGPVSCCR
ncbi:cupin domain-containing protein [Streptomyces sp. NPDC039028]|uniref:cupin domain-containing protein n=1 Tax=unclassified Streptomyces TaxID=2593676 RepID=UPI0033DA0C88